MPKVIRNYTVNELHRIYSKLSNLTDVETVFFLDASYYLLYEIRREYRLTFAESLRLVSLFNHFNFNDHISQTLFYTVLGNGGNWKKSLKYPFDVFFIYRQGKGIVLTEMGDAAFVALRAILRRVLQDREYLFELKFGRFTPEQRAKRKADLPFYRDLTEAQQIQVLREYWALPYQTDEERETRLTAKRQIWQKYRLDHFGIVNAVRAFGDSVKSVRDLPHLRGKFNHPKSKANDTKDLL